MSYRIECLLNYQFEGYDIVEMLKLVLQQADTACLAYPTILIPIDSLNLLAMIVTYVRKLIYQNTKMTRRPTSYAFAINKTSLMNTYGPCHHLTS